MGLFLAPIGIQYLAQYIWRSGTKLLKIASRVFQFQHTNKEKIESHRNESTNDSLLRAADQNNFRYTVSQIGITVIIIAILLPPLYRQTVAYSSYNDTLITQANATFAKEKADADLLIQTIKSLPPGRVFAGRGGTWGKDFRVAETPYFMHLSTYGIPTVLWLPETWSNNSDTEQYFSEDIPDHYDLYNIRYVVAPPKTEPQKFWHLIQETPSWKLYDVTNPGSTTNNPQSKSDYITTGVSPSLVYATKTTYANVIRLWIQSPYPERKLFPELSLTKNKKASQLPQFSMVDEATYRTSDNKTHALFSEQPVYMTPWEWPKAFPQYQLPDKKIGEKEELPISIISQSSDTDMVFKATITISEPCPTCVVVLKQTYHPNWKATVNGKPVESIDVFPSYTAIRLEEPGTYEVVFSYQPSKIKTLLLSTTILTLLTLSLILIHQKRSAK